MDEGTSSLNLTGTWQGQYSYGDRNKSPVPFSAMLNENEAWLEGIVEEIGTAGDARGLTISASIQGKRSGRSVTWIKIYHRAFRLYDSVQYKGEVSADGQEIEGRWQIGVSAFGRFMMIRQAGKAVARKKRVAVRLPAG